MTSLLHRRGRRRCVLFLDQFEFLLELIHSHIVHFSQLVELTQGKTSFTKIVLLRLAVVLRQVLIRRRFFFKKFVEQHVVIYTAGVPTPPAGIDPPGPPGAAPGVTGGTPPVGGAMPATSSPV